MRKYPKDVQVPPDEVKRRRLERRAARAMRPQRKVRKRVTRPGTLIRFRVAHGEREYVSPKLVCHLTHNRDFDTISLRVREVNASHLDWFWDFLRRQQESTLRRLLRVFPNVKEQSENVAAFRAVQPLLDLSKTIVIVVGDGSTPRCGALFACFARHVFSIDPVMRSEYVTPTREAAREAASNLTCVANTIEAWLEGMPELESPLAIVAVHAHVPFQRYLLRMHAKVGSFAAPILVLGIECCVPLFLTEDERRTWGFDVLDECEDWGILSPHRTVRIWRRSGSFAVTQE
jgi:hypothetical protein